MFLVCLECFEVVKTQTPLDDSGVIPMICNACRQTGYLARQGDRHYSAVHRLCHHDEIGHGLPGLASKPSVSMTLGINDATLDLTRPI